MNHIASIINALLIVAICWTANLPNASATTILPDEIYPDALEGLAAIQDTKIISQTTAEKLGAKWLEEEKYQWLDWLLASKNEISNLRLDYFRVRLLIHKGEVEQAKDAIDKLTKDLLELKGKKDSSPAVEFDEHLSWMFSWLREMDFDIFSARLEKLTAAYPDFHNLTAERLLWLDWLEGRQMAVAALRKLLTKSSISLHLALAEVFKNWDEPENCAVEIVYAWKMAQSEEELQTIYQRAVRLEQKHMAGLLAERLLEKQTDAKMLLQFHKDKSLNKLKLIEAAKKMKDSNDKQRYIAAELLLDLNKRKEALELAKKETSATNFDTHLLEAHLLGRLLESEYDQNKASKLRSRRLAIVKKLVESPKLKLVEKLRLASLIEEEKLDHEFFKLMRPFAEKLRDQENSFYLRTQQVRFLLLAGLQNQALLRLESLYKEKKDDNPAIMALLAETAQFIKDKIDDSQDRRLRQWVEKKPLELGNSCKDSTQTLACAEILSRLKKHGESVGLVIKSMQDEKISPEKRLLAAASIIKNTSNRRIYKILQKLEGEKLTPRQTLRLIELWFRINEQEKATELKHELSKTARYKNKLYLSRRLMPHYLNFLAELSYISRPQRISLDVFTHLLTIDLRHHCRETKNKTDFLEAFTLLNLMTKDLRIEDLNSSHELRYYLWRNQGQAIEGIHDILEMLPEKEEPELWLSSAAILARNTNSDFLETVAGKIKDIQSSNKGELAFILANLAAMKGPSQSALEEKLRGIWKDSFSDGTKARNYLKAAVVFLGIDSTMHDWCEIEIKRLKTIANRLEAEGKFMTNWKKLLEEATQPEGEFPDMPIGHLQVQADETMHILSASTCAESVNKELWKIEQCFAGQEMGEKISFKANLTSDTKGRIAKVNIYNLNSKHGVRPCIKTRLLNLEIKDIEPPFAYCHLEFEFVPDNNLTLTKQDLRRRIKRIKEEIDLHEKRQETIANEKELFQEYREFLRNQPQRYLELAEHLSWSPAMMETLAGWQTLLGQDEKSQDLHSLATWLNIGRYTLSLGTALAIVFLLHRIRRRRRSH